MDASTYVNDSDTRADVGAGVRKWWISGLLGVVMVAAALFIPAGRLDWVMGWALVLITLIWVIATGLVSTPELLAERAERRKGTKKWDMAILGLVGLGSVAKLIVAGLDVRFGWTVHMPLMLPLIALVVAVLGYAVGVWAMASNPFFSKVVRIQDDRGHSVATGGPYRFVRHPGYLGAILFELATPILLGSWWALIPGGFASLFFVVRTALEDKMLQVELPGYAEYARQTHYRLLPGVW